MPKSNKMLSFFWIVLMLLKESISINSICGENDSNRPAISLNWTDSSPASVFKLLSEGEKMITFGEDRDLVIFMGITGSGKSTLTLFLAGYDDQLLSKETRPRAKEYLIEDPCGHISPVSSTLQSYTLIPRGIIDPVRKTKYFDMPGFSDTRSVAFDIASAYFMKRVLDHARRVKLVFVVSHSNVMVGVDREKFTNLVAHITTLVPNISKFNESVALIVTKVANTYEPSNPPDNPYVSDEIVIENIVDFLTSARTLFANKNDHEGFQLMRAFLSRDNDTYSRIGIFRRPDRPGPLSRLKLLQKNKHQIKEIIDGNLHFTEKTNSDFGYTLSPESKYTLLKLKVELLNNASDLINNLGRQVITQFDSRQDLSYESNLEDLVSLFHNSTMDVFKYKNILDFTRYLEHYAKQFNVKLSDEDMTLLRVYSKFLDFSFDVSGEPIIDWSPTILRGMKETIEYLENSRLWYNLLNMIFNELSSYRVQRSRSQYNVHGLTDQMKQLYNSNSTKPISIAELNLMESFLEQIGNIEISRKFAAMTKVNVSKRQMLFLNEILDLTLLTQVTYSCDSDRYTLKGHYILLSDVSDSIRDCFQGKKFLELIVLEKFFIDTNINLTKKGVRQLMIIAPVWHTTGPYTITLNGEDGTDYWPNKAPSGSWYGQRDGHNGAPGLPGDSAGHFVGIGAVFIDSEQLTISAIGGAGGKGQDGGDGLPGEDGEEAESYDGIYRNIHSIWENFSIKVKKEFSIIQPIYTDEYVYIYGNPPRNGIGAANGGNGGNGGKAGLGGFGGHIILLDLNHTSNVGMKNISKSGLVNEWKNGQGGKGGRHGYVPRTLKERNGWLLLVKTTTFCEYLSYDFAYRAHDGNYGSDGIISDGIQSPQEIPFRNPSKTITSFKVFASENLRNNSLHRANLMQFLDKLESDVMVVNWHNDANKDNVVI